MQTKHDRVVLSGMAFSGIMLAILMVIAFSLTGCNTFNRIVKNETLVSQLAVEAATARVLHEHPNWRNDVVKITGNAITLIDGNAEVNLVSVEEYVKGMVNWSRLVPEEQALVSVLISQVVKNLEDGFLSNGITDPLAQMVQVRQVLEWIRSAAMRQ